MADFVKIAATAKRQGEGTMRVLSIVAASALLLAAVLIGGSAPAEPADDDQQGPRDRPVSGALTPSGLITEIEEAAAVRQQSGPANHARFFRFSTSGDRGEFEALGQNWVMLVTVLSQQAQELPVKRVYVRAGGKDVPLVRLSSWRSEVSTNLLAAKVYGRFREDGFYLLPIGLLLRDGYVMVDHAYTTGWVMLQLPSKVAKGSRAASFVKTDQAANTKPDLKTLQAFVRANFPGFPVPTSVTGDR